MRRMILALAVPALLASPMAQAAPTCQNRNGDTVRCEAADAMPVGWTLPPELWKQQAPQPGSASTGEVLNVLFGIALLFTLIALLPEFDGNSARDWCKQEDDDE